MHRVRIHKSFRKFRRQIKENLFRRDMKFREEMILSKLEIKLGKPKEEVKNLLSKDLIELLTQVPFSYQDKGFI